MKRIETKIVLKTDYQSYTIQEYDPPQGFIKHHHLIEGELVDKILGTGEKYKFKLMDLMALAEDGFEEAEEEIQAIKRLVHEYWDQVELYDPDNGESVVGWLPKRK